MAAECTSAGPEKRPPNPYRMRGGGIVGVIESKVHRSLILMEKKEKYSTKNLNHGTIYTYHFFFGFIDHRLACAYNSPLLDGLAYTFLSPTIFFIVRQNDLNFFFFLSAELGGGGGYSRQLEAVKGRTPSSSSFRGGKQNKKRL